MSAPAILPPGVEAAIRTSIREAYQAGAKGTGSRGAQILDRLQQLAVHRIETAIIVGQAQAEALAQDPHA